MPLNRRFEHDFLVGHGGFDCLYHHLVRIPRMHIVPKWYYYTTEDQLISH